MSQVYKLNAIVDGKSNDPYVRIKSVRLSGLFSTNKKKTNQEQVTEKVKSYILEHYKQDNNDIQIIVRITKIEKLKTDFLYFDKDGKI